MTATKAIDLEKESAEAQATFEASVEPQLRPQDYGKYVAIDIDTGDFELGADEYAAIRRLRDRSPGARSWLMRAGFPTTCRIGRSGVRDDQSC